MKMLLLMTFLSLSFNSFAQKSDVIDDLGTIDLNLDTSLSEIRNIHYPNYRMGGGNGATREIRDCLLLDIRHSDAVVTRREKLKLAKKLKVLEGHRLNEFEGTELPATRKGDQVVFYMSGGLLYMTSLQVRTRDGSKLNDIIEGSLPPVRAGSGFTAPTGLVYIRDCRF